MLSTDEPESHSLMVFKNKLDTFLVGLWYRNIVLHTGGRTAWSERCCPAEQSKVLQESEIITDQWVFFIIVQLECSDLILFKIISASLIWQSKNFCTPTRAYCFHPDSWHKLRGPELCYVYTTSGKEAIQKWKMAWHKKPHHAGCCLLPSLLLMVRVCKKKSSKRLQFNIMAILAINISYIVKSAIFDKIPYI